MEGNRYLFRVSRCIHRNLLEVSEAGSLVMLESAIKWVGYVERKIHLEKNGLMSFSSNKSSAHRALQ